MKKRRKAPREIIEAEKISKKFGAKLEKFWFLGMGAHNTNYILKTNKGLQVLRIELNDLGRLKTEYDFLKKLKGNFGPEVYFFDSTKKIIDKNYFLEDYVEGKKAPEKANKKLIEDVAKFLKKLHANKVQIKKKGKIYSSLKNYFEDYMKRYKSLKKVLEKRKESSLLKQLDKLFNDTKTICENNDKLLNKRKEQSIIHGNVDPEHIIYTDNGIKLIDWEFARYGLIESDLTFFIYLYELTENQRDFFFKKYKYPKTKQKMKEFNILFLLHHVGLANWCLERIKEVDEGKIYKDQESSDYNNLRDEILLHIREGGKILRELK